MRRLRILLIEDDALICALLAELLAGLGHDVCGTATTEMEAVAAALRHAPDLMIVDVNLQVGSGVSAMDTILRRSAMPHIFMTGGSQRPLPANATTLHKPFGTEGLKGALDSVAWQIAEPAPGGAHVLT